MLGFKIIHDGGFYTPAFRESAPNGAGTVHQHAPPRTQTKGDARKRNNHVEKMLDGFFLVERFEAPHGGLRSNL